MNAAFYKRHRFPAEIISHCIWLYHRFCLSFRDVEEMMLERGVVLSYETIRRWCLKFGSKYARRLKHRRPQQGDVWHVDEVFLAISGERHYLWREVDQRSDTLDILVTKKRNKRATKHFFQKLLKRYTKPSKIITDKLRSKTSCLGLLTCRAATSTTVQRTHINGCGNESGGCSALLPPAMPKDSCLFSSLSILTFAPVVTSLPPATTAELCMSDSHHGQRWRK